MLKRADVIKQFKRPSGALGWLAGIVMAVRPSNRQRNAWTIDLLALDETARVFELGCGPGLALALAAAEAKRGFVAGVDHSPLMVRMARQRLARAIKAKRASIDIGDETALDAAPGGFDAVYCVNVVQFIEDRARFLALARRALKPGGRFAATYQPRGRNPSNEAARAMASALSKDMEAAGFVDITVETLPLKPVQAVSIIGAAPAL